MAERALVRRLAHAGPLTWLLAALAAWAMLAWLAALLGMGGRIAPVEAAAAGPLPVAKAPSADRLGPLSQYADAASRPLFTVDGQPEGATREDGRVMGSYLHGMFTEDAFRRAFLASLGATPGNVSYDQTLEETLDALADHLAAHVATDRLLALA